MTRRSVSESSELAAIRLVAALSATPMVVTGLDGRFLVVNEAYCHLAGRTADEFAALTVWEVSHPDDLEADKAALRAMLEGRLEHVAGERRQVRPDGGIAWALLHAVPVREDGEIVAIFTQVVDITGRKLAEEALAASEARFRAVMENAPIGMGVCDLEGNWTSVNRALCDLAGRDEAALLGTRVRMLFPEEERLVEQEQIAALLAGKIASHKGRRRVVRPSGRTVWTQVNGAVMRDARGQAERVIVQIEDISERVRAEQALRDREDRLRRLAEATPDLVVFRYRYGPTPGYVYVSPGVEALVGYSAQEFYDDPYLTYAVVHPDDAAKLELLRHADSAAANPQTLRAVHRDGHVVWTEQRSVPIYDAAGVQVGFDAIAIDVTARVEAEQQLASRERHFRSLVQNSSDMVFITDAEGRILQATPSVQTVLGYAPADLVGRSRFDFFHPDDLAEAETAFAAHVANPGPVSMAELRVRSAAGEWRWLECAATNLLDDPDVRGIVLNARDVTERRELHEQLRRKANYDDLTGLMNWRRFMECLADELADRSADRPVGVLVLGLDRFGSINDTLGYQYGDQLLRLVAARLDEWTRPSALVARGGGKRFAILADLTDDPTGAATAGALLDLFDEPFFVEGQPLQVDATAGLAVFPRDSRDPELLLRRAEVARRRARTTGASYAEYVSDVAAPAADQIRYLGQLREAIGLGQLELHYQPKVDLAGAAVAGVEALVRWKHPDEGWVQPGQFIPLAEESGLIRPLTRWVVQTAVEQAARWQAAGLCLSVSANITARNLQDPTFVDTVAGLLDQGLRPADLTLELTERSVMTDPVAASATCRRLADLGVRLSLDDFGTGQSALAYLVSLPIDEIKIDRSFVVALGSRPEARAIVRAIVELAVNLDKAIVAEGVEDQATADLLQTLGCSTMQGYLFSPAVPVDEVVPWLTAGSWRTAAVGDRSSAG